MNPNSSNFEGLFGVLLFLILFVFGIPSLIAFWRNHPNRWVILAVNIFASPLGGIGWILALIWSLRAIHRAPRSTNGSNGGESGLNIFVNDLKNARTVNHRSDQPHKTQQLVELASLLDQGALTKHEYEKLKSEVIDAKTIGA